VDFAGVYHSICGAFFGTPIQMEFMVGLRRSMGKREVVSGSCAILRGVIDKRNCYG